MPITDSEIQALLDRVSRDIAHTIPKRCRDIVKEYFADVRENYYLRFGDDDST
jgi:hypothetical protein